MTASESTTAGGAEPENLDPALTGPTEAGASSSTDGPGAGSSSSTDGEPRNTEGETPTEESAIDEAPADPPVPDGDELPSTAELEEPSTEKSPDEEPKAPSREEPEPSHEAVGIGVIDDPE